MPLLDSKQFPSWFQWALLTLAVGVGFGAAVPDYYMAADDLFATDVMHRVAHDGHAGLFDRLVGVVFRAEGSGHFRPVQDVLYVLLYWLFGVDRWIFAVMVVYAACHIASARLIIAIMTRLGSPAPLAFSAGLLFALHPVWDDNLMSVQFGNNVPGLTSVLGACLLWLPVDGISRRRGLLRVAGAGALTCVAIGLGINLMVSAAFLLGLMAVAIARARRSMRDLVVRCLSLAAAGGISVIHRFLAYGAVGTLHTSYQNISNDYDLARFTREICEAAVLLLPSTSAVWSERLNPSGLTWDDGSVPLLSVDTAIVVATAIGLVACIVMSCRRSRESLRPGRPAALSHSFWFGVALTVAMLLPYYLFLGRAAVHRYLYPAIAGLAITATVIAGVAGRIIGRVIPRQAVSAVGYAALAMVLAVFLRIDREAARSIASGHRVTRAIVSTVAGDMAAHPEISRVFVVGYPRVIGRAGHSFAYQGHLRGVLNAKLGTTLDTSDEEYFDAVLEGRVKPPLGPETALYVADPDGVTLRRVPGGSEGKLPPHATREWLLAVSRLSHLHDPREVLSCLVSPRPEIVEVVLRVLFEIEGGERSALILEALDHSAGTPMLFAGALETARRDPRNGRTLASRIAVRASPSDDVERAALEIVVRGNGSFDAAKARSALEVERKAQVLAREVADAPLARESFRTAHDLWAAIGVTRDDLVESMALCRIAALDDAAAADLIAEWTAKGWRDLVRVVEGFEKSRHSGTLPGLSVRRATLGIGGRVVPGPTPAVDVIVQNSSDLFIPCGISPISARLIWTWPGPDGTSVPAGQQWLPGGGLEPGGTQALSWIPTVPAGPGARNLHVELVAFGKTSAVTDLAFEGASSRSTAGETR